MEPPKHLEEKTITGVPNSPIQGISGLLKKSLKPIISYLKTYIKDIILFVPMY